MRFKDFLINEDRAYLGIKMGDILNAIHSLSEDMDGMGPRQLATNAEKIVNEIRRVLHTHWPEDERKYLQKLQKIGVAMMKAIEEKGDLKQIVNSAKSELEQTLKNLGMPQNDFGSSPKVKQKEGSLSTPKVVEK